MNAIISTPPTITTPDKVTLRAVDQNAPVQAADCLSFPATLDLSTEKETASVKEGAEATQANKSVGATDDDQDSQQEVPSPAPTMSTTTVYASVRYGISFPFQGPGRRESNTWPSLHQKPLRHLQSYHRQPHAFSLKVFSKCPTRQRGGESGDPRHHAQLAPQTEAICRTPRSVFRAGAPWKRRRLDTASSPACPSLGAPSGQVPH